MPVQVLRDLPRVMLELAGSDEEGQMVVLVEPSEIDRCDELIGAIETYYPKVRLTGYDRSNWGRPDPQGLSMTPATPASAPDTEIGPPARVKGSRHRLRSLVVKVDPRADAGALVSDEEISMLLDPGEDASQQPVAAEKGGSHAHPG